MSKLASFCQSISNCEPVQVPIRPEYWCLPDYCFRNVEQQVAEKGGKMVLGWAIIDAGTILIAMHHAVWETPSGDLIDITPSPIPILAFVPDPTATLFVVDGVRLSRGSKCVPKGKKGKADAIRFRQLEWETTQERKRAASGQSDKLSKEARKRRKKLLRRRKK